MKVKRFIRHESFGALALGIDGVLIPFLHFAEIPLLILSVLLFASWIGLRVVQKSPLLPRSPVTFPLLVFLVLFIPMSIAVSVGTASAAQANVLVVGVFTMLYLSEREIDFTGYRVVTILGAIVSLAGILCLQPSYKFPVVSEISFAIAEISPIRSFFNSVNGNELAGVLALFIPLSVAVLLTAIRKRDRSSVWITTSMFVVLVFGLLLTQSRAGLLASLAGVATIFLLSGRWGQKRLFVGLIAAGAVLLIFGVTRFFDVLLFAGKNSGVSLNNVLSGRLDIWRTAVTLIQDFPTTGIGLSSMSHLVTRYYSASGTELHGQMDAHQMFLHVFMDFGIGGGVLFIGVGMLIVMMLRSLLRRHATTSENRIPIVGLSGSFVAMVVFGMFDALAPGSYASLFLFLFAGLIASEYYCLQRDALRRHSRIITACSVACVIVMLSISPVREVNFRNLKAVHVMHSDARDLELLHEMRRESSSIPSLNWFMGHLYRTNGDHSSATSAWSDELRHTSRHLRYLMMLRPNDTTLAALAVNHYSDEALAYFWFASAVKTHDTARAIVAYRRGLERDPTDGLRWRLYGDLLATSKPYEAMQAYAESGRHGDPGANGFLLAGETAERLGDHRLAISYYRQSRYTPALHRADALDSLLRSKTVY